MLVGFFSLVNLSLLILPLLSSGQLLHMGKNTKVNDWPILSPPLFTWGACRVFVSIDVPHACCLPLPSTYSVRLPGYILSLGPFLIPSRIDSIFNPAWFRGCNTFSIGNAGDLSFSLSPRFSPPPLLFQFILCSRFSVHAREWSVCVLMRKGEFFHFYHSFINPLTGARWLFWSAGIVLRVGGAGNNWMDTQQLTRFAVDVFLKQRSASPACNNLSIPSHTRPPTSLVGNIQYTRKLTLSPALLFVFSCVFSQSSESRAFISAHRYIWSLSANLLEQMYLG